MTLKSAKSTKAPDTIQEPNLDTSLPLNMSLELPPLPDSSSSTSDEPLECNTNLLNVAQDRVPTEAFSKHSNTLTKHNSCTPSPTSFAERNSLKRRLPDCNDLLLCSPSILPAPAKQITSTHLNASFNRDQPTYERLIKSFFDKSNRKFSELITDN